MIPSPQDAAGAVPVPVAPSAARRIRRQRQLSLVEDGAGPIVKWAGGKAALSPDLAARAPRAFGRYFEPFLGGGALFFHLAPPIATLGDSNVDLIILYEALRLSASDVHRGASELAADHQADPVSAYRRVRSAWNDDRGSWSRLRRASTFLYLNRACFNGLYRVNKSGAMNTPIGRGPVGQPFPSIPPLARLVATGDRLASATLLCGDYAASVADARAGDFVYFDPPYAPLSKTSNFVGYSAGGFGSDDHARLAELAVDLVRRGVKVMVSSADVPGAADAYTDFRVHRASCARSVSARTAGRARVGELILTGGYEVAA